MKHIGWIALSGISIGVVSGGLAMAFGADQFGTLAKDRLGDWSRWADDRAWDFDGDVCNNSRGDSTSPERHIAWDGNDNVVIALGADVIYRAGEGDDMVVRGAPEAVARVEVHNGKIGWCGRGRRDRGALEVTLPGREFRHLTVAGSGHVSMEKMAQSDINLTIAGSGTISAKGSVDRVSITIAGSGDALLGDLAMKRLDVKIAGSGNTEASPQEDADVTIMGSGDVKLLTKPTHLTTNIMGSGRVRQPDARATKSSAT